MGAPPPLQENSGAANDIWSSMLKSVGGVNATPSGTLLLLGKSRNLHVWKFKMLSLLGGSKETQIGLIKQLQKSSIVNQTSQGFTNATPPKFPEIANSFSLGYTYIEFKEYDHDGAATIIYKDLG